MKKGILILLIVEFLIAGVVGMETCILRRGEVQARNAWRDNPNVETKAELDKQKWITLSMNMGVVAFLYGVMAVPTLLLRHAFFREKAGRSAVPEKTA